jgi:hypothetical protein
MVRIISKKVEFEISPQEWGLLFTLMLKLGKKMGKESTPSFIDTLMESTDHLEGVVSSFGGAMTSIVDLVATWRQSSLDDLPPEARAQRYNYYEAIRVTGKESLQRIIENKDSPLEMMEALTEMHSTMEGIYINSGLNRGRLDGPRQVEELPEEIDLSNSSQ